MSNDPIADERAYWFNFLGIADDGSSLAELRNRTPGAVHVNKSMQAGGTGITYLTQAQADARYVQLANAIPLSSTTPIKNAKNGVVGTEGAASHGDHVHPVPAMFTSILYSTTGKVTALKGAGGNTAGNTLNRLYAYPYPLFSADFRDFTINGAAVRCGTGQPASNARLGLYKSLPTGFPDWTQLLFDLSVATTAAGDCAGSFSNIIIPCGLYWAAVVQQGAMASLDNTTSVIPVPNTDDGSARVVQAFGVVGVTGALPTSTPSIGAANENPANLFLSLV